MISSGAGWMGKDKKGHTTKIEEVLAREYASLTNYQDKYIIMTGGTYIHHYARIRVVFNDVDMYDIKRNKWSSCTRRKGDIGSAFTNHSSVSLNGKIFLFFG